MKIKVYLTRLPIQLPKLYVYYITITIINLKITYKTKKDLINQLETSCKKHKHLKSIVNSDCIKYNVFVNLINDNNLKKLGIKINFRQRNELTK